MPATLIQINRHGRITRVYILADSDTEEAIVMDALARITRPSVWGWLFRLFRRRAIC